MKKASELLEESAGPFDEACMLVRQMEKDLAEARATLYAIANSYDDHELRDAAKRGYEALSS